MAQPTIQTSYASGEWAPKLRSRVDIQKYHSGAAFLRNFFVDYSGGGASTRQGTKFINQCKAAGARLVPFQPSTTVSYTLEFGQNYIRFYTNGAPVLENAVTGGTAASGDTFTIANSFSVGDWVYALDWGGLTNVNGNYFIISGASGSAVTVVDLYGNAVTFAGTYTSGGQLQRVYTLATPYNTSDLFPNPATGNPGIKWVQDVTSLIITHPSYAPAILTINSANNWTYAAITIGATITAPASPALTSTDSGGTTWYYAYEVTAVDANGQESPPALASIALTHYIGTTAMAITFTWDASPGAQSYNIYKASPSYEAAVPSGSQFGFISNVTGLTFTDSEPGINPDFSQTPPIVQNPFSGASVQSLALTANANYTTVPTVTIAAPSSGIQATGYASLAAYAETINNGGTGFVVNDTVNLGNGVVIQVLTISGAFGTIATAKIISGGSITSGATPTNPVAQVSTSGTGGGASFNLTWHIGALNLVSGGTGYTAVPTVTLSGGATATATLGPASAGNPGVPGLFQQRLALAAQTQAIQSYNFSQPVSFFNFNVSNPSEDDDAISGTIISEELNDIRSLIPVPTGLIALTGKGAWLINGGGGISTMNPITPSSQTANPQAFNGANDLRPLKINLDVLYGTNKGNYVRDLTYNIYANIYTGSDISVLSNHLFFGHYLLDWAWSEEPFKTAWAVRDDGTMLSLGFVKEQDLIGWAHHDTNGQFLSVCSVIENNNGNIVDAVYVIVQRQVNGETVQYVERIADRYFTHGWIDSWSVDCALRTAAFLASTGSLQASGISGSVTLTATGDTPFTSTMAANNYRVDSIDGAVYEIIAFASSTLVIATVIRPPNYYNQYTSIPFSMATGNWHIWQPVTTVTGLQQLIGQEVYGVADGAAVGPLIVSASGSVTLATAASKITLGLQFLPQLKTLPLDLGEPTVQGKRKKISAVTLRVADTLGLEIGTTFANVVPMKDFQLGNLGSQSNVEVTDLVNLSNSMTAAEDNLDNGDGRTIIDQDWQEAGSYCIQQNLPYPATILGAFPEVTVGDTQR